MSNSNDTLSGIIGIVVFILFYLFHRIRLEMIYEVSALGTEGQDSQSEITKLNDEREIKLPLSENLF